MHINLFIGLPDLNQGEVIRPDFRDDIPVLVGEVHIMVRLRGLEPLRDIIPLPPQAEKGGKSYPHGQLLSDGVR